MSAAELGEQPRISGIGSISSAYDSLCSVISALASAAKSRAWAQTAAKGRRRCERKVGPQDMPRN